MAKNKKISEKQAFLAKQRKEQRQAVSKASARKHRTKKIVITTVSCVVAAGLITGVTIWGVKTNPMMHLISVESTAHYSINAAEMSFYSWQIYQRYLENNSDSDSLPDSTKPLSSQSYDEDMTWEEYFADAAKDYAQNILILCEGAETEDYQPSEDVSSVAESAVESFDETSFPAGVTQEDAQHAMELYLLAWDYSSSLNESFTFTTDERNSYYEENAETMELCSYDSFAFSFDDSDETSLSQTDVEELARELRRCTTKDSFEAWVYDYYKENTSLSEEELQSQVSTLYTENAAYTEDDELSEWAFSEDTTVGNTTIITDTDSGTMTVYLLLAEPTRDETYPVNIRQVLFTSSSYGSVDTAHSAAEAALEEWQSGDQTEDSFAELANQYTEDTTADGGLYTDVTQTQMLSNWKDWCFDTSRQAGDVTILDSSYGSCIIYFVSADDMPAWEITATDALKESAYEEKYQEMQNQADVQVSDFLMRFVKSDGSN